MVEIIAGVYLVSFLIAALLGVWNYTSLHAQQNSKSLGILNKNLKKISLFWSTSEENFSSWSPDAVSADAKKSLRAGIFLGLLCFAGLAGLILLSVVLVSMRLVGPRRRTLRVFRSDLAKNEHLSLPAVEQIHREILELE